MVTMGVGGRVAELKTFPPWSELKWELMRDDTIPTGCYLSWYRFRPMRDQTLVGMLGGRGGSIYNRVVG